MEFSKSPQSLAIHWHLCNCCLVTVGLEEGHFLAKLILIDGVAWLRVLDKLNCIALGLRVF